MTTLIQQAPFTSSNYVLPFQGSLVTSVSYFQLDKDQIIQSLIEENTSLKAQLEASQTETKSFQEQCETLEKRNIELEAQNFRLQINLNRCLEQLSDLNCELDRFQLKEQSYKDSLAKKDEDLKAKSEQNRQAQNQIKNLGRELSQAAKEGRLLGKAQSDLQEAKESLKEANKEVRKLRKEVKDLEKKSDEIKKKNHLDGPQPPRKDHTNSNIPSSHVIGRGKIVNGREKTDRKPGGQPGHKGHRRPDLPADYTQEIIPEEVLANPQDYKRLNRKPKSNKEIGFQALFPVTEYLRPYFKNLKTGQIIHASPPKGMHNEINFSADLKAFAAILHIYEGISVENTADLIEYLSGGRVKMSVGCIQDINHTIAENLEMMKVEDNLNQILFESLYICDDFGVVKLNGLNKYIYVSCNDQAVLYTYEPKKGKAGVEDRIIAKGYTGIIVHDHDKSYYIILEDREKHQECLVHIDRDMNYSEQLFGGELEWIKMMRELLQLGIHLYDHSGKAGEKRIGNETQISPELFSSYYDTILEIADQEYEALFKDDNSGDIKKHHSKDLNLLKRFKDYKAATLNFLTNEIPSNNNFAEKQLRFMKTKMKISGGFRSGLSDDELKTLKKGLAVNDYCLTMSLIQTAKLYGDNPLEVFRLIVF